MIPVQNCVRTVTTLYSASGQVYCDNNGTHHTCGKKKRAQAKKTCSARQFNIQNAGISRTTDQEKEEAR